MASINTSLFPAQVAGAIADPVNGGVKNTIFSYPEAVIRILGAISAIDLVRGASAPTSPLLHQVWLKPATISAGVITEADVKIYNGTAWADPTRELWANAMGMQGLTGATGPAGTNGTNGAAGVGYDGIQSASSLAVGQGNKTFALNKLGALAVGSRVRAASRANAASNWMEGVITSVTGNSVVVAVDLAGGSGTLADWNVGISGQPAGSGASPELI